MANAPEAVVERITPAMAKQYLENNISDNRRLRKHTVDRYADQIARGQWRLTGETIKFTKDGELFDGQHRLAGVVKANKAIESYVVRGLNKNAYDVVDSGMKRSTADNLTRMGMQRATLTASVAKTLIGIENGLNLFNTTEMGLITNQDISEFASTNAEMLSEAVALGSYMDTQVGGNATAWSVFLFQAFSAGFGEQAREFVDIIVSGEGLSGGDARLALKNWLQRNRTTGRTLQRYVNAATFIKLFNNYLSKTYTKGVKQWQPTQEWPAVANVKVKVAKTS